MKIAFHHSHSGFESEDDCGALMITNEGKYWTRNHMVSC